MIPVNISGKASGRYFWCKAAGKRLLGKGVEVVEIPEGGTGNEASSRAPKAKALSIAYL